MRLAPALLAVSALSGCAAGRDYTRPQVALSAAYHAPVQARGQEAEALAQFRGAVLRATEEVETAIVRLAETRTEITLREQQVASLTRSRDQARQGYAGGALSLVDVLDADRPLLEATDRLAAARAEAARASVAAVRALGGGWETRSG